MKLIVAIKVEDVAQREGTGRDREFVGEANTAIWGSASCSGNKAGGSSNKATVKPESHLMLPPNWRASCRGVETTASLLFE